MEVSVKNGWSGTKAWFGLVGVAGLSVAFAFGARVLAEAQDSAAGLAGTSWQLVKFVGVDGKRVAPDDGSKYTIAFDADGGVSARLDCNRGRGTWKSAGANQLQFGPMALTRAMCPPGSMDTQIARNWENVRSYVTRDGHLFLSLMADGGSYEFELTGAAQAELPGPSLTSRGPFEWACTSASGGTETLKATFYNTQPGLVLMERGGKMRPAFQAVSGSGARHVWKDVSYWEHQGQATVRWSETELTCKRSGGPGSD